MIVKVLANKNVKILSHYTRRILKTHIFFPMVYNTLNTYLTIMHKAVPFLQSDLSAASLQMFSRDSMACARSFRMVSFHLMHGSPHLCCWPMGAGWPIASLPWD